MINTCKFWFAIVLILLTLSFCRNPMILFYMSLTNLSNWRPNSNQNKLKAMIMELLVNVVFGSQYFVLSNPFSPIVSRWKGERNNMSDWNTYLNRQSHISFNSTWVFSNIFSNTTLHSQKVLPIFIEILFRQKKTISCT